MTIRAASHPRVRAFTIIELLVTVAIIILLLGLLLVGLQQAARAAQVAQTKTLMSSINRALVSFKTDVGYYPPVLGRRGGNGSQPVGQAGFARDLLAPPSLDATPSNADVQAVQAWNSFTSLPEYLLGYGPRSADGFGVDVRSSSPQGTAVLLEAPPLGIRHPGSDGAWGAWTPTNLALPAGVFQGRSVNVSNPQLDNDVNARTFRGKPLGPYLELKDTALLGGITDYNVTTGEPTVVRATESPDFESLPKCIVDYWGRPIRYFRKPYRMPDCAALRPKVATGPDAGGFDCGDFFGLRPQSFAQGTDVDGFADAQGDTSTSRELQTADFVLLSYGPDKSWDPFTRADAQGYNKDNIVEAGP